MSNVIIWMVTVIYPFLVWFSLDYLQPRYLALDSGRSLSCCVFACVSDKLIEGDVGAGFPACMLFLLLVR